MEVLICGGCKGNVPEAFASQHWHPARFPSISAVGEGLGGDLSVHRAITGVQKSMLGLQLHEGGWHKDACQTGSLGQMGRPLCIAPEHVFLN